MQSNGLRTPFAPTIRRLGILPTRFLITVNIARQQLALWQQAPRSPGQFPAYQLLGEVPASTSRFGIGQVQDSNRTPLGLHRIAQKIGGGFPQGTVFRGRKPVGFTWKGLPDASIAHRILWMEGLEPGFNRGDGIDSFHRYIYIHGFSDETTLGRPASHGCIHIAAEHLIPLYDWLPVGTLVWIHKR